MRVHLRRFERIYVVLRRICDYPVAMATVNTTTRPHAPRLSLPRPNRPRGAIPAAPPPATPHFWPAGQIWRFCAKCGVGRQGAWARWWGRCGATRMRLGRCLEGSMARLAAKYGPQTRRAHAPTTPSKILIFVTAHAVLPLLRGAGERFWKGRPEGRKTVKFCHLQKLDKPMVLITVQIMC